MRHALWQRAAVMLVGTAFLAACDDSTDPAPSATAIEAVTSATVSGQAGLAVSPNPTVRVLGPGGAPAAGVIVTFAALGLGAVEAPNAVTDANGIASPGAWILGPSTAPQSLTASVEGLSPVVFTATNAPGLPLIATIVSGNFQGAPPGEAIPDPIVVQVRDMFNNLVPNQVVTFAIASGGGTIAGGASATATTNAQGVASISPWVMGPTSGPNTILATSGAASVTFTATGFGPCEIQPTIAAGGSVNGTIAAGDCEVSGVPRDNYRLTVTAGQPVVITFNATGFTPGIFLNTPTGTPRAQTATGSLQFIPGVSETLVLGVSATAGGETGTYSLSVASSTGAATGCAPANAATVGVIGLAQELTASDCLTQGTTAFYGAPYNGTGPYQSDIFQVYLTSGQQVRIRMEPSGAAVGDMDAMIVVFGPTNVRTFRDGGFLSPEEFVYTAAATGFHRIIFTSFGLATGVPDPWMFGDYLMSIRNP